MRFQQFAQNIAVPVAQAEYDEARNLAVNINWGWEPWLQVEYFLALQQHGPGLHAFHREPQYPASLLRADFNFVPANAQATTTWVELKVENNGDAAGAIHRYYGDIEKIQGVHVGANDSVGALVIVPIDADVALQEARNMPMAARQRVRYYLVTDTDVSQRYDLSDDPMTNGDEILVMYYVLP